MCTKITDPCICPGSSAAATRGNAMMDVYSYPCVPAMRARIGPSEAPCAIVTGIFVPSSLPLGTSIHPETFWPERCRGKQNDAGDENCSGSDHGTSSGRCDLRD